LSFALCWKCVLLFFPNMSADTAAMKVGPHTADTRRHDETQLAKQDLKTRAIALTKNPQFRTVTITTAGGAVTLSTVGGAFGCAAGIVTGSLAGIVPAIFTLGMSIPVGATMGGTVGLVVGASAGGATGAAGGGMVGYGGHKYRNEISAGVIHIKKSAQGGVRSVQVFVNDKSDAAKTKAVQHYNFSKVKLASGAAVIRQGVKERAGKLERHHVVIGGAGAGAVAGGTAGGGVGTLAGGAIGAAVGIIPALCTFGLSIPFCAIVGGGIGLGVGTAAGGTGGAVAGGAAGYGGHKYRKEIGDGARGLKSGLGSSAGSVRVKVQERAAQARERISAVLGGTGGTE